jgi:hypothetical protein
MQALAERLSPYEATRIGSGPASALWSALIACDASVPNPEPVLDVDEANDAEVARRALLRHLARLETSEPEGPGAVAEVIDLRNRRLRRAS